MATIQILNKETLSDKKYPLKYISFEKPDADGTFHNQQKEVYFRPDAVAVLLVDEKQKKLLLTKQFRLAAFLNGNDSGYIIEVCAGLIDNEETPEQTALREVEEETGYEVSDLEKIAGAYSSPSGVTEFLHLFIAKYNSDKNHYKTGGLKEEGESIELIELSFEEAKEKLKQSEFRDIKTILLLQHFFISH
ncbi:MAG: GDP-mannose pyrophosphatase NudK [Mucilaginibacter sp.]|nr:GDP-mannose pyrophosphatase NudK [Mucilaginibacter sp.]